MREICNNRSEGYDWIHLLKVISYAYWILRYRAAPFEGILVYEIYDWR